MLDANFTLLTKGSDKYSSDRVKIRRKRNTRRRGASSTTIGGKREWTGVEKDDDGRPLWTSVLGLHGIRMQVPTQQSYQELLIGLRRKNE